MPGYRGRSRSLVLVVLAVVSCLLMACTGRSQPGEAPSSGASLSTDPPSSSVGGAPDYVAMKRDLQQRLAGDDLSLDAVRAVLVSVDGDTVLSDYRDRRPTDYAHVLSVTKSVMSILVGIAIDEGRLRLDQTLAELLPAHADEMTDEIKSVTLRQLLTMTAGIQSRPLVDTSAEDLIDEIVSDALVSEPGTAFRLLQRERPPRRRGPAERGRSSPPGLRPGKAIRPTRYRHPTGLARLGCRSRPP